MGKRKIKGLNQTIKRWKLILDDCMSSSDSFSYYRMRFCENSWDGMVPPCGFCEYYLFENKYKLPPFRCSPECPVVKYRGNICFKDKSYSGFWKARTKDEGIPYAMEILVWLFQLKDGVFDE